MEAQSSNHDMLPTSSITADFQEPNDWTYSMRREMQEIVKGLFLGPYSVAVRSKVGLLHGLKYVLPTDVVYALSSFFPGKLS